MKMVFENVTKLSQNDNGSEYNTTLSGLKLAELWNEGIIEYVGDIQRGYKIVVDKEKNEIEVPIFSQKTVDNIRRKILSKKYFVDQITLNITNNDYIDVEEKDGSLIVNNGEIAILDGQHRIRALSEILNDMQTGDTSFTKEDLENLIFPVKVSTYSNEIGQQQFYQYSLGNKISSTRAEFFNTEDYPNLIVKSLLNDSVLSNKIETVKNSISKNERHNVTTYATMVNAIKLVYPEFSSKEEALDLANYLKQFFAELFNIIPEFKDFDRRKESKETSLLCENFSFYGYIGIAKFIQYMSDWEEKLKVIKYIDLDKSAKSWAGKVTKNTKVNKKGNSTVKYSIINSTDSRRYMVMNMEKLFKEELRKEGLL